MSLSVNRNRRLNAGSKMSSLMASQDPSLSDHFYDQIYGGFDEDDNDVDYHYNTDGSTDSEDSDISMDENDEPISDDHNDDQPIRQSKRKQKFVFKSNKRAKQTKPKATKDLMAKEVKTKKVPFILDIEGVGHIASTSGLRSAKSNDLFDKIFESQLNAKEKKKRSKAKPIDKSCTKELTQSELLKEAVITEKMNLQSLREYERLEVERNKKSKSKKQSINGPFIRFNSVSMPLIEELDVQTSDANVSHKSDVKSYSRSFITFSDEQMFNSFVNSFSNSSQVKSSTALVCPVTQLPARYIDPISGLPFGNSKAFNAIRNQYYKQLEIYGNVNQTEVKHWIDWRQESADKWLEWEKQFNCYDTVPQMQSHSQTIQSQPNVVSIPKVIHSSRNRKK